MNTILLQLLSHFSVSGFFPLILNNPTPIRFSPHHSHKTALVRLTSDLPTARSNGQFSPCPSAHPGELTSPFSLSHALGDPPSCRIPSVSGHSLLLSLAGSFSSPSTSRKGPMDVLGPLLYLHMLSRGSSVIPSNTINTVTTPKFTSPAQMSP